MFELNLVKKVNGIKTNERISCRALNGYQAYRFWLENEFRGNKEFQQEEKKRTFKQRAINHRKRLRDQEIRDFLNS